MPDIRMNRQTSMGQQRSAVSPPRVVMDVLWCLAIPVVVLTVYALLGSGIVTLIGDDRSVLGTIVLGLMVAGVIAAVRALRPTWLAHRPGPRPMSETPNFWTMAALGLALAFLAGQGMSLLAYEWIGSPGFEQTQQLRREAGTTLVLLLSLVGAPLGEEALFRGLIYPLLRRRVGIGVSVLVTALTFALLHGNIVQIAAAWPMAVLMTLVYERTRCLAATVAGHLVFNLAALSVPAHPMALLVNPVSTLLTLAAFLACAWLVHTPVTRRPQAVPGAPALDRGD